MRRFEFNDGKSSKFWEITLDGNTYTVRYGRMGSDGQSNTKVFKDAAEAEKQAKKVTASKVKKGYAEVEAQAPAAKEGSNPDLESAIETNPNDPAAWAVFGDWLSAQGDARGELVALQLAVAANPDDSDLKRKELALLEKHNRAWMGDFAKEDWAECSEFSWRNGFWRSAKVFKDWDHDDLEVSKMLGVVLRHPSARFLDALYLGLDDLEGDAGYQEMMDSIVKHGKRPGLRLLHVGAFEYPDDNEISWTEVGSAANLYTVLPDLEDLTMTGGSIALGAIDAPKLKRLKLETGGLPKEPLQQLAKASLPALETLEIWLGTEDYGAECTVEDVAAVLANRSGLSAVRWLGLMNSDHSNQLPALVLKSGWLDQIETLDFSMGTMTDEGANVLLENAAAFASLKRLNLDDNYISTAVAAKLNVKLPNATVASQDDPGEYGTYVTVGE